MSCKGGCGFHGNPNTNDMCSKCFRDYMQKLGVEMPNPNMKPSAEGKASVTKAEEKLLGGLVTLSVRLGDLTVDKVDAIVNAANRSLSHASGLAGAIVKRGGDIIQDESDIYIAERGKLDDGGVMYTHAGKLPCKYVIHTVGPMWRNGREGEEQVLALAVRNTLDMALQLKCASVTIPAISSGIFGFPKEKCGKILYDTVVAYCAEKKDDKQFTLRDIRLTNFDDQTVDVFVRYHAARQKELKDAADKAKAAGAGAGAAAAGGGGGAAAAGDVKAPPPSAAGAAGGVSAPAGAAGAGAAGGGGAALGAGGKLKVLLLGDDLTAGLYGVYTHPLYGPHDAVTGAQPAAYNNEPTPQTVKYHGYIKRLTERLKAGGLGPDVVEPVARAYVNATADVVLAKLNAQPLSSELGTGAFAVAVVLVGAHDVFGVDTSASSAAGANAAATATAAAVKQIGDIHALLKGKYRVANTVAVLLPPIDTANVAELATAADRAAAAQVREAINAQLKAGAAAAGYSVCDPLPKLPQGKATAQLWDDAWHLSPAGSDALGDAVFEHLSAAKLLPAPRK